MNAGARVAAFAGTCAAHPEASAQWACGTACERRTRPEAPPLCPACWSKREAAVEAQGRTDSRRLQMGGLAHPLLMG